MRGCLWGNCSTLTERVHGTDEFTKPSQGQTHEEAIRHARCANLQLELALPLHHLLTLLWQPAGPLMAQLSCQTLYADTIILMLPHALLITLFFANRQ